MGNLNSKVLNQGVAKAAPKPKKVTKKKEG